MTPAEKEAFIEDLKVRKKERNRVKRRATYLRHGRKWYIDNKTDKTDERCEYERQWRLAHKDETKAYRTKWRKNNPEWFYRFYRRKHMRVNYGLTEDEWQAKFKEQGSCCGICKSPTTKGKNWHTDHCSKTGLVRSILCQNCNFTIANHSAEHLRKCADYVEHWAEVHTTVGGTSGR